MGGLTLLRFMAWVRSDKAEPIRTGVKGDDSKGHSVTLVILCKPPSELVNNTFLFEIGPGARYLPYSISLGRREKGVERNPQSTYFIICAVRTVTMAASFEEKHHGQVSRFFGGGHVSGVLQRIRRAACTKQTA